MLLLSERDLIALAEPLELVSVVERAAALYESGDFTMPNRISVPQGENSYLYMPCFTPDAHGTKMLSLFPQNPKRGLARIQGVMLLTDPQTGRASALLDGASLTALRTGAVGAAGIRRTTMPDASSLALIGAGVQGYHQCLFAAKVRPLRTILIYDADETRALDCALRLRQTLGSVEVRACPDAAQAVAGAGIVVTATTAREPVVPDDRALVRGRHFIGIGSYRPDMREYPRAVFEEAGSVLIDVDFAKEETGDLALPLREGWISGERVLTLGKAGSGDIDLTGTTLYKSVGMALFDVLVADFLVRRAQRAGVGTQVDF